MRTAENFNHDMDDTSVWEEYFFQKAVHYPFKIEGSVLVQYTL
jgi:hypothetical protein